MGAPYVMRISHTERQLRLAQLLHIASTIGSNHACSATHEATPNRGSQESGRICAMTFDLKG